jgi:RHS repeat-associated protein
MRVAATVNDQETRFLLDSTQQRYAQVIEEYLANGGLTRSYAYGHDLLSQDDTSTRRYYQVDGLGSTRQLTDASGNVTLSYDYQAFGELLQKVGSGNNRFLFAGEQFDDSVGLAYLRRRYFDTTIGRFSSADLFEGFPANPLSLHDYGYAEANPIIRIDPEGKFGFIEFNLTLDLEISHALAVASIGAKASLFARLVCDLRSGSKIDAMDYLVDYIADFEIFVLTVLFGSGSLSLVGGLSAFSRPIAKCTN